MTAQVTSIAAMTVRATRIDLLSLSALGFFLVYVGAALLA